MQARTDAERAVRILGAQEQVDGATGHADRVVCVVVRPPDRLPIGQHTLQVQHGKQRGDRQRGSGKRSISQQQPGRHGCASGQEEAEQRQRQRDALDEGDRCRPGQEVRARQEEHIGEVEEPEQGRDVGLIAVGLRPDKGPGAGGSHRRHAEQQQREAGADLGTAETERAHTQPDRREGAADWLAGRDDRTAAHVSHGHSSSLGVERWNNRSEDDAHLCHLQGVPIDSDVGRLFISQ